MKPTKKQIEEEARFRMLRASRNGAFETEPFSYYYLQVLKELKR